MDGLPRPPVWTRQSPPVLQVSCITTTGFVRGAAASASLQVFTMPMVPRRNGDLPAM